jgi:transcription initiation factor TFIIIB Brf1 subunit/transcription initiation factor TFIIB
VCVKCAFVQNDVVTTDNTSKENTSHDNLKTPQRLVNDRNDIFLELKSRGVINDKVLNDAFYYCEKWLKEKIPLQKVHHAYALYYSAKVNHFPLTLKEVSYYTQITMKDICKIEKFFNIDFFESPYHYLSKFCSVLNLTFMDEKIITSYLSLNYKNNVRNPSHVAAAAISNVFPSIEKKLIANVSWTSITTIRKIAQDLQRGVFK